jgi:hypothetical protein
MRRQKQMRKAFGVNESGLIDFPAKISNVQISRLQYGNERGCSRCFPHGLETGNSTVINRQRNWKRFRRTKWKSIKMKAGHPGLFSFIAGRLNKARLVF